MLLEAERDLARLEKAKSSRDARKAWHDFLEHSNRALNRLEGYAKRAGQTRKYKQLISKDIWQN